MDLGIRTIVAQPQWVLLAGSALLAAGLSVLLGLAMAFLRARRRDHARVEAPASTPDGVEPAPATGGLVDLVDESAPRPAVDLGQIDERLEDVEAQLERLHHRIDALLRQRELRSKERTASSPAAVGDAGSEEERMLREMVARHR